MALEILMVIVIGMNFLLWYSVFHDVKRIPSARNQKLSGALRKAAESVGISYEDEAQGAVEPWRDRLPPDQWSDMAEKRHMELHKQGKI